jgi:hypothetical protein
MMLAASEFQIRDRLDVASSTSPLSIIPDTWMAMGRLTQMICTVRWQKQTYFAAVGFTKLGLNTFQVSISFTA